MSTDSAYGPYVPPAVPSRHHPRAKAEDRKAAEPAAMDAAAPAPGAGPAKPAVPAAPAGPYTPPPLLGEEELGKLGPYEPPAGLGSGGHGRYIPPSCNKGIGSAIHSSHPRSQVPAQVARGDSGSDGAAVGKAEPQPEPQLAPEPAEPAPPPAEPPLPESNPLEMTQPEPIRPEKMPGKPAASNREEPAQPLPVEPEPESVMEPAPRLRPKPGREPLPEPATETPPERASQIYLAPADRWTYWLQANPELAALWSQWMQANPVQADQWSQWALERPEEAMNWAVALLERATQWSRWAQANPEQAAQWAEWAKAHPEEAARWAEAYANLPAQPPQPAYPSPAADVPGVSDPAISTGLFDPIADSPGTGAGTVFETEKSYGTADRGAGEDVHGGTGEDAAEDAAVPVRRANYRGGLFDQLDVPAAASFLVCAVLFVLLIVWVKSVDYSRLDRQTIEDVPERIARILMPLKPPGKAVAKAPLERKPGPGPGKPSAAPGADASASARIERSRRTVTGKVQETQERVKRVAVLSILSGKGPGTQGATSASSARARARAGGLVDFGGLEDKLANLEGLTKFDSKSTVNKSPETRDDGAGALAGIDKMMKGFQNAKVGTLAKVGVAELEKPELLERNSKYTGNRSMSDVGAFIGRKQGAISMLYEERLKIDPTLEGKITVVLVIEEDGTVSSATVLRSETTLDDAGFQAELLRRIRRWIFPPSTGGPVEMKSPFVFKPA